MSYSIGTGRTRSYDDPTDLPITEIHGNALGAVAAQRLAAITDEARFESASRAFLNSLLRMTFWYDDQTDEVSRDLTNLGLFLPFGGAHSATPWESCEAQLSLVWLLGNAPDLPAETRQLLLKLTGLYRRSALQFYCQTWSERVRALDPALQAGPGDGLPVEPFYSLEGGGHRGGLAAYMAGVGIWNWWVYEALAEATDPEVTVLNLAVHGSFDEAIAGLDRSFLVWNPGPESRRFALRLKRLPAGRYDVIVGAERTTRSQAELSEGLPLDLPAGGSAHVTVSRLDAEEASATLAATRLAQRALERAYAELQMAAEAGEPTDEAVAHFREAMDAYHTGDLAVAATRARDGLAALGQ